MGTVRGMNKANREPNWPAGRQGFSRRRKSRSGGQSLAAELSRLRRISIDQRMIEALSIRADVVDLLPTETDA